MDAKTCEEGVPDWDHYGVPYVSPCGERAFAMWGFGGEDYYYVCKEHDEWLRDEEGDAPGWVRHELLRTQGDQR